MKNECFDGFFFKKNFHPSKVEKSTLQSKNFEGNTLTINKTKVVLEVITVCGKTMREHLEVINHRDAISYVEDVMHKEGPFSEW